MPSVQVQKIATFSGHSDCVYNLVKSGETTFYSVGGDGQVVFWDLNNPEQGKVIAKVDSSVYAAFLDQDRKWLIIGQNFEGIHIINVDNNTLVKSINVTKSAIFDIVVFGDKVFVACGNGEIIVVELEEFTTVAKLNFSTKSVRCLKISESNQLIAGYSDHHIRVIDTNNFTLLKDWEAHKNSVFSLENYQSVVYSVGRDAQIRLWDSENDFKEEQVIPAHMYTINHITIRDDKKYMATCSMDKSIKIWDLKTRELLKVIDNLKFPAHGTSVNRLAWLSDTTLLSCSDDRTITAWEIVIEE